MVERQQGVAEVPVSHEAEEIFPSYVDKVAEMVNMDPKEIVERSDQYDFLRYTPEGVDSIMRLSEDPENAQKLYDLVIDESAEELLRLTAEGGKNLSQFRLDVEEEDKRYDLVDSNNVAELRRILIEGERMEELGKKAEDAFDGLRGQGAKVTLEGVREAGLLLTVAVQEMFANAGLEVLAKARGKQLPAANAISYWNKVKLSKIFDLLAPLQPVALLGTKYAIKGVSSAHEAMFDLMIAAGFLTAGYMVRNRKRMVFGSEMKTSLGLQGKLDDGLKSDEKDV